MKSVVLLSGGLDSTVSLAHCLRENEIELCLTMDYGQRSAVREINSASAIAEYYNLNHMVVDLPFLRKITFSALVNTSKVVPSPSADLLDDPQAARDSAAAVWAPNRNGLFINAAACFAEALDCGQIVTGFNREEARTFPDNSPEFVKAANEALAFSTRNRVRLVSYTQRLDKVEIVRLGEKLKVPWRLIWSCYHGGSEMCGACESCLRFFRAMKEAGIDGYSEPGCSGNSPV